MNIIMIHFFVFIEQPVATHHSELTTRQTQPTRSLCRYHNNQNSLSCSYHDTCIESTFQCGSQGFSLAYAKPRCETIRLITHSNEDCKYCLKTPELVNWVLQTEVCVQPHLEELASSYNKTIGDPMDCLQFEKDAFNVLQSCYNKQMSSLDHILAGNVNSSVLSDLRKIINLFTISDYYRPLVTRKFHELLEESSANDNVVQSFAPSDPLRIIFCVVATRNKNQISETLIYNTMGSQLGQGTYGLASNKFYDSKCATHSPPSANVALQTEFRLVQWIPSSTTPEVDQYYSVQLQEFPGTELKFFEYSRTSDVCGNGKREAGEMCDMFADNVDADSEGYGCTDVCTVDDGYDCTVEQLGKSECFKTRCGDGLRTHGEECDDNNTISNDGCSQYCTIEPSYECTTTYNQTSLCQLKPLKSSTTSIVHSTSSIEPTTSTVLYITATPTVTVLPTRTPIVGGPVRSSSIVHRSQCWSLIVPLLLTCLIALFSTR